MRSTSPVRLGSRLLAASALATLLVGGSASALVLVDKSPELKFRSDVGKQVSGYLACIIKASQKCEKSGSLAAGECNLVTKTATPPADAKGKFADDLAKCDAKVDLDKKAKGLTYEDIGCPGDCNPGVPGNQRCTDLQAFEDFTVGDTGTRASISLQSAAIGLLTGCSDNASCLAEAARYGAFALAALKCMGSCEADYKNKKGDGGNTDDPVCHLPVGAPADPGGSDPKLVDCITKAKDKAEKKLGAMNAILKDGISAALNQSVDAFNNAPGGNCGP